MKYLVVVLLFISSVCSAREIWDGYFYIDGKKMDCDVIAEYRVVAPEEYNNYTITSSHPYKLLSTSYTGKYKSNDIYLSVEYPLYSNSYYPRLNKLIPIKEFHLNKDKRKK